jgi:CMP-2-keto-3-deoxyoctulosonic acid synthetase
MYIILKHNPKLTAGSLTIHHILFEESGRDRFNNPISALDNNGDPIVMDIVQYDLPYLKKESIDIIHWLEDNKHKLKTKH